MVLEAILGVVALILITMMLYVSIDPKRATAMLYPKE